MTVSATGGSAPYTGTGTFTKKAGTYSFPVTDANGCAMMATVTIGEPTVLVAKAEATPIGCYGGDSTVTVSATGGTAPSAVECLATFFPRRGWASRRLDTKKAA